MILVKSAQILSRFSDFRKSKVLLDGIKMFNCSYAVKKKPNSFPEVRKSRNQVFMVRAS